MELCTCRICGFSFYSKRNTNICRDCEEVSSETYDRIVAYLRQFPNSNALQISDALHIPAYDVLTYLENGQLLKSRGNFEQIPDIQKNHPMISNSPQLPPAKRNRQG